MSGKMRYIRIACIFILVTLLSACRTLKINDDKLEYKYGLLDGVYGDVTSFIEDYQIVREDYYKYNLLKNNKKVVDNTFSEIISVDLQLIKYYIKIGKNDLKFVFLGLDRNLKQLSVIKDDKVVSVINQVTAVHGITKYGFITMFYENGDSIYNYYDFNGNLIGENYTVAYIDAYYNNQEYDLVTENYNIMSSNLGQGVMVFRCQNNTFDVYIGDKKIKDVNKFTVNTNQFTYTLRVLNKFYVYDLNGNLIQGEIEDSRRINLGEMALLYDQNKKQSYILISENQKMYIDDKYLNDEIKVHYYTKDMTIYELIKSRTIIYQSKNETKEYKNATITKIYNGAFIILTNGEYKLFNFYGKEISSFIDLFSLSFIDKKTGNDIITKSTSGKEYFIGLLFYNEVEKNIIMSIRI